MRCTCGIPNKANYYLDVIVEREDDGQVDNVDVYLCDEHTPNVPEGHHNAQSDPYWFGDYATTVHDSLKFDRADEWDVIGYALTELR